MIDYFNIPGNNLGTQVFYFVPSSTSVNEFDFWQKPKNCKFVYIIAIGGGGGGAGGQSGTANRYGGGGGGSSSVSRGFYPANLLPDILYVQVGKGGSGGTSGGSGGSGQLSYVCTRPNTLAVNAVLVSGGNPAGGGITTTGGAGGTIFSSPNLIPAYFGIAAVNAGIQGASGGIASAPPTAGSSISVSFVTNGGAGGGGVSGTGGTPAITPASGGSINQSLYTPRILGGSAGGGDTGGSGLFTLLPNTKDVITKPMYFTGGAGGGGLHSPSGATGGNGSYGSGGGGGGGGTIGGLGGNGGDGIVIITAL